MCPECIISGKASKELGVFFHYPEELQANEAAVDEVSYRTPGYTSWQKERWLACCNDLCVFHGCLKSEDITRMGIEHEIMIALEENEDYIAMNLPINVIIYSINSGDIDLCVFECMHCGKYKVDLNLSNEDKNV